MLIADTAGMGKTTLLTHLSEQIKQKCLAYWVEKIDFNDHTDVLEATRSRRQELLSFFCEKLLNFAIHLKRNCLNSAVGEEKKQQMWY